MLGVSPRWHEHTDPMPGDDLVPHPDAVLDTAFTLDAPPETVWPWFAQLGKDRGGWYMPRWLETVVPLNKRALRHIEPALQTLGVGDVIPDWGGTFEIVAHDPPHTLVHRSRRGRLSISWAITLTQENSTTRVHLRFRLSGARHPRLARRGGGVIDTLTVAALAAGLAERVGPVR